ncbi:MAG: chemotaxis protein CheB [Nannocystaceae bacterium]
MDNFRVIAIGASAGGLNALEEFFAALVGDERGSLAAYCVIQHLSPDFKSLMAQILERHTSLTIAVAEDGMLIEPGHLYLNRREQHVVCENGRFRLLPEQERRLVQFPIDLFFKSVATCYGPRAIAVVLSGTGSDGSRGIRAVKAAGGQVFVQSPDSAQFDGMPHAALATDIVDGVGTPPQLASRMTAELADDLDAEPVADGDEEQEKHWPRHWRGAFTQLLRLLRAHSGIDFALYKSSTLIRRLDKHLALHALPLPEYVALVRERESERDLLVRDFLIGVTSFFRDPEVFDHLRRETIPQLLSERVDGEELRIWVAGCSSGEEAYCYAIILTQLFAARGEPADFKILATDVDAQAVRVASEGRYPEAALRSLPPATRDSFFTRLGDDFVVTKALREKIVFSQHNLLADPPFVRIDLVSMRNVLIYLRPTAQRDVLTNAAFALRPGGVLVLGTSGSLGEASDAFDTVDSRLRLFRRRLGVDVRWARNAQRLPLRSYDHERLSRQRARMRAPADDLNRSLLELYVPPLVVVDDDYQIIQVHGDVGRLFQLPEGPPTSDLRMMLRGTLGGVLSTTLRQARQRQLPVAVQGVPLDSSDDVIDVSVRPLPGVQKRYACEFRRRDPAPQDLEVRHFSTVDTGRVAELERILAGKQEELQTLVEELETANEELQSTNEELIAGNEELQSTNEELQAVNEELYTVNAELESRNSELLELSNDVDNLLNTTDIATLVLDGDLNIRRFTPALREVFDLDQGDIGRSLLTFASALDEPSAQISSLASAVLADHKPREDRVRDRRGRTYLRRVHPFVTDTGDIKGVVLTLVEVTNLEAMAAELGRHEEQAAAALDLMRGAFFEIHPGADKIHLRGDIAALFDAVKGTDHSMSTQALLARVHPDDRAQAEAAFCVEERAGGPVDFRLLADTGEYRSIRARARLRPADDGGSPWIVGVLFDVSDWVESEQALRRSRARLDLLMSHLPNGIVMVLGEDAIVREVYADSELERLKLRPSDMIGTALSDIYSTEVAALILRECRRALDDENAVTFEHHFGAHTYLVSAMPLPAAATENRQLLLMSTNITDLRRARDELRRAKETAERANSSRLTFLAAMSHELRTPLAAMLGILDLLDCGPADPKTGPYLAELRAFVVAQERLISDLLDLSRIDAEQLAVEVERFVVSDALSSLLSHVRESIERDLAIEIHLPAAEATFVGDPVRVLQIVNNLVSNAIKYTEVGKVTVAVDVDERGALHIEVADTGVGIAEDDLEGIFEIFARTADAHLRADGAGIGLAIVHRLVDQMGGTIAVESVVGEGSTFRLAIPPGALEESRESEAEEESDLAILSGRRILVVEDNDVLRVVIGELLHRDGMEVEEAIDAAQADRALASRSFDAVLMDIGLPDRSGLEIIRSIRAAENGGPRMPVVALTAYAYAEDIERSLSAGADLHLAKPVGHSTLRHALSKLLRDGATATRRAPGRRARELVLAAPRPVLPD